MVFWGVEIKPGKPYTHRLDDKRARLHISQAALGIAAPAKANKTTLQINVGDKSPIVLCHFIPNGPEMCLLDTELEEEEDVVFSVLGPRSVNLSGYYLGGVGGCNHDHNDSDTESFGEDIDGSESGSDYDEDEFSDEYENDFIDDEDIEMYSSSPKRKSGVVIEEILDDEESVKENGDLKRLKRKKQVSDSDDDDLQIVVKEQSSVLVEDEDGFPVSSLSKDKKTNTDSDQSKSLKRKKETSEAGRTESEASQLKDSSAQPSDASHGNDEKSKKKKNKEKAPKQSDDDVKVDTFAQDQLVGGHAENVQSTEKSPSKPLVDTVSDMDSSDVKKNKKKKKKNKKIKAEDTPKTNEAEQNNAVVATETKKSKGKQQHVREYSNGLIIEELEMGDPKGQKAAPGKKVSMKYIGKLKKTGEIFDSTANGRPFKFRLGVGQVISGWDVGINGMRIGDKRRLTIPPSMAYGEKKAGQIPPNSWLVFDVELVSVH